MADATPYTFEVFYKEKIDGQVYEHLAILRFATVREARDERQRLLQGEIDPDQDTRYDWQIGELHGPDIQHHYVPRTEVASQLQTFRLPGVEE